MTAPIQPVMDGGINIQATTSSVGTNYTVYPSQPAKQLTLINDTGVTIYWQQSNSSVDMPLPDSSSFTIFGISDASQVKIRRKDGANTQVTVPARAEW